jgi:hypothetical protein
VASGETVQEDCGGIVSPPIKRTIFVQDDVITVRKSNSMISLGRPDLGSPVQIVRRQRLGVTAL